MSGVLRLGNTGAGTGRSTLEASASNDQTFTLPSAGGTLLTSNTSIPGGTITLDGADVIISNGDLNVDSGTLFVDESTNRVGIGKTNPAHKLDLLDTNGATYTPQAFVFNATARIENNSTVTNSFASLAFRTGSGDNALGFIYTGTTNQADFVLVNDGGNNGLERLRVTANGTVLVGTDTPENTFLVQVDSPSFRVASFNRYGADASLVSIGSCRGTQASRTALNANEFGGIVSFTAYDGSSFSELGRISGKTENAPTVGDTPGELSFQTTPEGSSSPTEKFTIDSFGNSLNVSLISDSDIATATSFQLLPSFGSSRKRTYSFSGGAVASINTIEGLYKIVFTGNNDDRTAHFKISANTRNTVSQGGNVGHTYTDFTFSTGGQNVPRLVVNETRVNTVSYNSGFCKPLLANSNEVYIFISSNTTSSSGRLDIDNIIIELESTFPSLFTIEKISGTPATNGVSDPEKVLDYNINQNISIDGIITNAIRGSGVAVRGGSTTGTFTVTVSNLRTLNGNNYYNGGVFLGFRGIRTNAANEQTSLGYYAFRGVSTWNTLVTNDIVNNITASVVASTTNSITIEFIPANQSVNGSFFVIAHANGSNPTITYAS